MADGRVPSEPGSREPSQQAVSAVPASIPRALPGLGNFETLALFGFRRSDGEGGYYVSEHYHSFDNIAETSGLPRKHVRRAVRGLARKGIAKFASGLWCEFNDRPAGAGYALTESGRELATAFDDIGEIAFWAGVRVRRDSDGSPKGGDACGSVHDSAGPQGHRPDTVTPEQARELVERAAR